MASYYEILGLTKSATADEIKSAYRTLAKKYHPDLNNGDATSTAKFKELSEAYDILSNPDKRSFYDRTGSTNQQQNNGGGWAYTGPGSVPPEFEHIFDQIFRRQPNRGPRRNDDISVTMSVNLEDAYKGISTPIHFKTSSGKPIDLLVNIPAGVENGIRVRYQGKGDQSIASMPAGDVYVQIIINQHPKFELMGIDLHAILEVDAIDAIIGYKARFDCINGSTIDVTVPAGTQHGSNLRISGHGMPNRNLPNKFGNLILHVSIKVPTNLSKQQLDTLTDLQHNKVNSAIGDKV